MRNKKSSQDVGASTGAKQNKPLQIYTEKTGVSRGEAMG